MFGIIRDINGNELDVSGFSSVMIHGVAMDGGTVYFVCSFEGNASFRPLVTLDAENHLAAASYFASPEARAA